MPTAKQIAANRLNSKKATGPRTSHGKAASRFNSLKHGLYATQRFIFDETAEQLAGLGAEYHERHNPSNPAEYALVETLIDSEWRLRRLRRVETRLWDRASLDFRIHTLVIEDPLSDTRLSRNFKTSPCTSGEAFLAASADFERHQRIVNSAQREFHSALKELAACAQAPPTPQPQDSTPSSAKLASFRQNPPTTPASAELALRQDPQTAAYNPCMGAPHILV